MNQPLLVIDCHYLCHRASHSAGHLSFGGVSTGVAFQFLRSITTFKDEFQTDRIAFCFEGKNLIRKRIYPDYKNKRKAERTDEEKKNDDLLSRQIRALREEHLPEIGFSNIFSLTGYESDDLMAAIANHSTSDVVLITSDSDLYQCLRPNVTIYSPQKQQLITEGWFRSTYKVSPAQWALVKAIGGCSTDNVKGIKGVGEATALKYVQGSLPQSTKAFSDIRCSEGRRIVRRNRDLVELPFARCPVPILLEDKISAGAWRSVCGRLGLRSIASRLPIAAGL